MFSDCEDGSSPSTCHSDCVPLSTTELMLWSLSHNSAVSNLTRTICLFSWWRFVHSDVIECGPLCCWENIRSCGNGVNVHRKLLLTVEVRESNAKSRYLLVTLLVLLLCQCLSLTAVRVTDSCTGPDFNNYVNYRPASVGQIPAKSSKLRWGSIHLKVTSFRVITCGKRWQSKEILCRCLRLTRTPFCLSQKESIIH